MVSKLNINTYHGSTLDIIKKLHRKHNFKAIGFNIDYTEYAIKRDKEIENFCKQFSILCICKHDRLLHDFNEYKPYKVFTLFYNHIKDKKVSLDFKKINKFNDFKKINKFIDLKSREVPKIVLELNKKYGEQVDSIIMKANMHSIFIRFGVKSIREMYYEFSKMDNKIDLIRNLIWHDFYLVNGYNLRKIPDRKWKTDPILFNKWKNGLTDSILVNGIMIQLKRTGFITNRARLVAADYLINHLYLDWRLGEQYFSKVLLDHDILVNHGNWHWVAEQPSFKKLNPDLNLEKYFKNKVIL
jgi:deoxyribodipyrimidine photo-lyase